jgi:hypothetical protein
MRTIFTAVIPLALLACDGSKLPADSGAVQADGTADDDADEGPGPDDCDDSPSELICVDGVATMCDADGDIVSTEDCAESGQTCFEPAGCTTCGVTLSVAHMNEDAESAFLRIRPEVNEDNRGWERLHARPVTISATDPDLDLGVASWRLEGDGFQLLSDGAFEGAAGVLDLPITLLVHANSLGNATFTASHSLCPETEQTVQFHSGRQPPFTGNYLDEPPWIERVRVFNRDQDIYTAIHPGRHADRAGAPYDVYITPRRTPLEWAADPTLEDLTGSGPTHSRLATDSVASNRVKASDSPLPVGANKVGVYDVVLDFNGNATLDPGDLMMGPGEGQPGVTIMGDLSQAGPFDVESFQHWGGTWLTQKVYYPASIEGMGLVPLVVISHGNGHNYLWYDYLGEHLASHGYVVMAHTNLTGPGIETASSSTLENTDYFLSVLDDVEGGVLDDHVDSSRIIWIGHSRGGEGVVRAYDRMVDEDYETDYYDAHDIVLISSIAPTTFYTVEYSNPHDRPYHLFAGAADGDVHGGPSSTVVQFFRLTSAAESAVQTTYLHGVGHNEFNCCGFADARGPALLGRSQAQKIAKSYYLALIHAYARGHLPSLDFFSRRADVFRPMGISDGAVIINEYRPEPGTHSVAIDDFQTGLGVEEASSGAVVETDASNVVEDYLEDGNWSLSWSSSDPMNGMTQGCCDGDTNRGVVLDWEDEDAAIAWHLPESKRDLRSYRWLSFRAAQGTRHPATTWLGGPLDFSVSLVDTDGDEATLWFGQFGQISSPYNRWGLGSGFGWANEFSTIRLRLTDFWETEAALNLGQIETVRFDLGPSFGSARGRIGIDNVLLEY